jgi:hypothetical protein
MGWLLLVNSRYTLVSRNMAKKTMVLGYAVVATLLVGVVLASVPFVGSLRPSAKAKTLAGMQRIDITDFAASSYRLITVRNRRVEESEELTRYRPGKAWLIIRDDLGRFFVYNLPTWEDAVLMPRSTWGELAGFCQDFGIAMTESRITDQTMIQCNDANNDQHFAEHWYWSLDGRNKSRELPDLQLIRSREEGHELAIVDPFWEIE